MARPGPGVLGAPRLAPRLLLWLLLLLLQWPESAGAQAGPRAPCAAACTCAGDSLDCSGRGLATLPRDLPSWTRSLNLSYNRLSEIDSAAFEDLTNLQEVYLNSNELTAIPSLGAASIGVVSLFLQHNKILSVDGSQLKSYLSLEVLDLSSNNITEIRSSCFPNGLRIRELNLASNRISILESGAFDGLSRSLLTLRLSKNRITQLPVKAFKLPRLTQLDLNRNRIRLIEGLTFQGLDSLEVLRLQRNNISRLTDGAFWGLSKMHVLHLEYNSLVEVNSGSLYGLTALHQLHLSNNSISRIQRDGWSFCQKLHELILSFNNLTRLDEESLAELSSLSILRLSHNAISHIAEGAFKGLKSLRVLDLDHNEISGTIEDTSGAFTGLDNLSKLTLFGNKIKSVAKRAFSGLESLEHLNLGENAIRSVQFDAFAKMKNLKELYISSESFLCDCQLKWLPPWLMGRMLQAFVTATCAHPESLKGQSIFSVLPDSFVCDDFPKPQIITQPETTMAVVGKDIRFTCSAASSSSSPMTFAWKKDNEVLANADMENFAHVRAQDGEVMEYTTILHLRHVTFGHEGRYQCIITNHFGSTYSHKARLTVNVLPSFTKIPHDIAIRTGTTARLECAATGHPNPQIAWQKDGGTDFPAARERRMHVMPDDDVFFITDVKIDDMGVYSCTAQNSAGSVSANATLTVLETPSLAVPLEDRVVTVGETVAFQCKATGSPTPRITWLKGGRPLSLTERHHFTPGNQLLVVQNVMIDDAGRYTCEMSNPLGTERAHSQLSILPTPGCRKDGTTVGIFTIAVVCSIVLTSLVWVCIIYQTRKKSEEYSVTNTDETIVPPDVPSYLTLMADGLKPFRKDLITGQRRSSPWSVVEASVKPGSCTHSMGSLYSQVSRLAPLSSSRSRFHAFILGLLNTKQLELWFSSLQEDAGLLSLLYLPTGFFSLARGSCPSLATELLLLLQPLSVLTFHLDLLFEHHHHLPVGLQQAPAPSCPPPALQQTMQAVLHWGERLAQSLRGTSGESTTDSSTPSARPPAGSWWDQLTQASRVYASGGTEGFPLLRWGPRRHGTTAEAAQEAPPPTEQTTPGRSVWLGRLFGVPGCPSETESGAFKSRRPSSWLPPTVSVLALVKRGTPPETPPEALVSSPGSVVQADRAVRALCDHTAAGPDQLSFQRGELLRVIATVDEDWLRCGRDGVEGLVPVGYTSLVL